MKRSKLVKDGEDFLLKKAPLDSQGFGPYQNKPFLVPTTIRKEAPTGNTHVGSILPKAVINRFFQVGGNQTTEAFEVIFDSTQRDEGVETPPAMTP